MGCSSGLDADDNDTSKVNEDSAESSDAKEAESVEETAVDNEAYPLPILPGWEEEEVSFEVIGNGTIDLWKGQFTFEGEIEEYFEPYQEALKDLGYEVTVTDDLEGRKTLEFTQVIDGDEYDGNAAFARNLITTGLQRFK